MKRLLISAVGIAALTGLGFVTPAHAVSHGVYINEGRVSTNPGDCTRAGGSASGDPTSASGTITVNRYPCANGNYAQRTGPIDASFTGTVTCVYVNGNMSVISGNITSSTGAFTVANTFLEVSFDNSSPSSASNPDQDAIQGLNGPIDCSQPVVVATEPLTSGDIRIV